MRSGPPGYLARLEEDARAVLAQAGYEAAVQAGRALPFDEAVDLVLGSVSATWGRVCRGRLPKRDDPVMSPVIASGASSVIAVFLVAVMVLGYVVIWAIWHFAFRGRDEHGRRVDKRD